MTAPKHIHLADSMQQQLQTLITLNETTTKTLADIEKAVASNTRTIDTLTQHVAALERIIKSHKVKS